MKRVLKAVQFFFLLIIFGGSVFAVGELDLSFNQTGKVTTSFNLGTLALHGVALQADGKIVAVGEVFNSGNYDIVLVRYNSDGTLDNSFDGDGKVITSVGRGNDSAKAVAIQEDGKIVVAGSSANEIAFDFAVVRYNPDGSLDTSFDGDGKVVTPVGAFYSTAFALTIQFDGKIVAVGDAFGDEKDFAVVRYSKDGSLDRSFDNDGILLTPISLEMTDSAYSVAVQNDGKLVVCGSSADTSASNFLLSSSFVVVRYNRNGQLDTSFANNGKFIASFGTQNETAKSVFIQTDGKILLSGGNGAFANNGILVRLNRNGTLDNDFDNDGIKEFANELIENQIVQPDGKILFSRRSGTFPNWTFSVMRTNSQGIIDPTFGQNGNSFSASGILALQNDGKIVAGSLFEENSFVIARLIGDSPIPSQANVSGRVLNYREKAVFKSLVSLKNLQTGEIRYSLTNQAGYFRFNSLPTSNYYQITVNDKRFLFTKDVQTFLLRENKDGLLVISDIP